MPCTPFKTADGVAGIVCTSGRSKRCGCGNRATLLCDWKVPTKRSGTCDAPICPSCSTSPAPGKDLCRGHAALYVEWLSTKGGDRKHEDC